MEASVKSRWDVVWGESDRQKARRLEDQGLHYRKDGQLDRRYACSRWMENHRSGKTFGSMLRPEGFGG